jgi:hypothetical protein
VCDKPHTPDTVNQAKTGDMPQGWAHSNLIFLVRIMPFCKEDGTLYVLSGIPLDLIGVGERISVQDAPMMLGEEVSHTLSYHAGGGMALDPTPTADSPEAVVHFPLSRGQKITPARVNCRPVPAVRFHTNPDESTRTCARQYSIRTAKLRSC